MQLQLYQLNGNYRKLNWVQLSLQGDLEASRASGGGGGAAGTDPQVALQRNGRHINVETEVIHFTLSYI